MRGALKRGPLTIPMTALLHPPIQSFHPRVRTGALAPAPPLLQCAIVSTSNHGIS